MSVSGDRVQFERVQRDLGLPGVHLGVVAPIGTSQISLIYIVLFHAKQPLHAVIKVLVSDLSRAVRGVRLVTNGDRGWGG